MASQSTHAGGHRNDSLTPAAAAPPSISAPPHIHSTARITPTVPLIIVILAVIFFLSGLLHLLVRFISRSSSLPSDPESGGIPTVDSRQLQQLFHLYDSGLDQSFIDSLPLFSFCSVVGPRRREAFDCAVCLVEFGEDDRLRLLPNCGHAFHQSCIDTWLLSNSTCPLCRGSLFLLPMDNHLLGIMYDDDSPPQKLHDHDDGGAAGDNGGGEGGGSKVFSVKLGKFTKNLSAQHEKDGGGESSTGGASVDGRRCFSMGSFQYVVGEPSLRVKLGLDEHGSGLVPPVGLDLDGKRLSGVSRRDSLSISKIWLWPRKETLLGEKKDASYSKNGVGNGV